MCQIKSFKDAKWHVEWGECVWSWTTTTTECDGDGRGGEEDATTTTAKCDGDGRFIVVSSSSDVCRKDDHPAGEAPQARRRTTTEMNDDNKDDNHQPLSSRLGNWNKRMRRDHEEMAMDTHTIIKQITRRGG